MLRVSRGTPAHPKMWSVAAFTNQARDRARHLLALALQPGRLLHASGAAPRKRGQLTAESKRGARRALVQSSTPYPFFNTSTRRACPTARRSDCETTTISLDVDTALAF